MSASSSTPRPFAFAHDFGDEATASPAPRKKRVYLAEEVEAIRAEAYAAGAATAEARAAQAQAHALADLAAAARDGLGALAQVALDHRTACAELVLSAARTIAAGALDAFPEAPLMAAIDRLEREIESQPRLVVRMASLDPERRDAIAAAIAQTGFQGQVAFRDAEPGPIGAFALEWADGRAFYDAHEVGARIAEAFRAALASEGLHGEPSIRGG